MLCRSTALVMVVLLGSVAWAEESREESLEPIPITEDTRTVRVVTNARLPDECLAPAEITRIDGIRQSVPTRGFMIEPGLHRLNGRAVLDTTRCWPMDKNQRIPPAADLEVNFEAGNVYYLAYDRNHPDVNRWQLVVWKVEQALPFLPDPNDAQILPEPDSVQ
jgi:hypothetical protein